MRFVTKGYGLFLFFLICLATGLDFSGGLALATGTNHSRTKSAPATHDEGAEKLLSESYSELSLNKLLTPTPNDRNQILQALLKLKSQAHPIAGKAMGDPALEYLELNPPKSLDHIVRSFHRGAPQPTAYVIRHMMQICTECHESAAKPAFANLKPTISFTLIELADFYKFTGRSKDALLYYEKILTTPGAANSRPDIWEQAAMNIVALGIASTGEPFTYVDVMANLLQETVVSKPQKALATAWRTAGKNWGMERQLPTTRSNELLDHVRTLIQAGNSDNNSKADTGLVAFSRAMLELKKVMATGTLEQKTRAFRMAGETREKIPLTGIWLNADDYYEACIRSMPHGNDAAFCWKQLSTLPQRDPRFILDAENSGQLQMLLR